MPTIKDVTPHVSELAQAISKLPGVKHVYAHGSLVTHSDQPNYPIKDIDLIAVTKFDSGDLMAIDAGRDSPLKMAATEWEDLGFNPDAVSFTKQFLYNRQYKVDHWATSSDGKLLHWGPMHENVEEWQEAHSKAETYANKLTGYNRLKIANQNEELQNSWRCAYLSSINQRVSKKEQLMGWLPSEHTAKEILDKSKKLA